MNTRAQKSLCIPTRVIRDKEHGFMGKYRYLSVFFIFLLMSCQSSKVDWDTSVVASGPSVSPSRTENANIAYPYWFWQPLLDLPFPTAVGYALTGRYPEKALKKAIDDGIESVAKSTRVRIHGKQISINGQLIPRFREELDAGVKEHVQEKHEHLATYHGEALTMIFVGLGTTPNLPNHVTTASPSPPNWLENLPSQPGYTYAHGQSHMGAYPDKAWARAEHRARVNLALTIESNVSILKKLHRGSLRIITRTHIDVTLKGIETVERWYDVQKRVCHVLLRTSLT